MSKRRELPSFSGNGQLVHGFFEELALTSSPVTPVLWKRCVDDTFCIMKRDEVVFFQHLNSIRPFIQFTVELEDRGALPFLDCKLTRILK